MEQNKYTVNRKNGIVCTVRLFDVDRVTYAVDAVNCRRKYTSFCVIKNSFWHTNWSPFDGYF